MCLLSLAVLAALIGWSVGNKISGVDSCGLCILNLNCLTMYGMVTGGAFDENFDSFLGYYCPLIYD